MASGDSQGKTIALFVFVSLTAITGLSAHYFWDKFDRLEKTKTQAEKNASEAGRQQSEIDRKYGELSERILGAGQRSHDEMLEAVKSDLLSPKLSEPRAQTVKAYHSYADAVDYLSKELRLSDERKLALLQDIEELQTTLANLEQRYQLEVDEAVNAKTTKAAELDAEKQKLQALIDAKKAEINAYNTKVGTTITAFRQERQDMENEAKDLGDAIAKTRLLIENASRGEQLRGQIQFERPDGTVVQTVPTLGQAYIDLGYEDNLFTGLTFSVYGSDTGGSAYSLPKANLEVVRVEAKRSLARVTAENELNPVLPGDLIYNPIWSRDNTASIAFVGLIFVDDDEVEDNNLFASMIRDQGGRIDAHVTDLDSGRIEGAINVNTAWLVLGEVPEISQSQYEAEKNRRAQALQSATSELRAQAQANGVRVINLRNFLTFMGMETPQRVVPAGTEEKFFFGKRRPRLVDTAPRPAVENNNSNNQSN